MQAAILPVPVSRMHMHPVANKGSTSTVLAEIGSLLFASLSRSDQRRNGMLYLQGLLEVDGRKSIRNIATALGGEAGESRPANEQSLHHFINSSTWDWAPVRQSLAEYLMRVAPPQAWVIHPMITPITGHDTVGVDRRFIPALGQLLNAQLGIGVWSASEETSSPISWRLHLSPEWLLDARRRSKASIPDHLVAESLEKCTTEAFIDLFTTWRLPIRPVVFDACGLDALKAIQRVRAAGLPVMARIRSDLPLTAAEPAIASCGTQPLPATHILAGLRDMRRLVAWTDDSSRHVKRISVVSTARVRMPEYSPRPGLGRDDEMVLIGAEIPGHLGPMECWLTDVPTATPSALFRLSRLLEWVEQDATEIGGEIGIQDFRGRSFGGWHRHVTIASAAHAVMALSRRTELEASFVS
jgi:SRSO17 transposase